MSARLERALARLATEKAVLACEREGAGFGVFPRGDRRRRPVARLSAADVRALEGEGVLTSIEADAFVLSAAGHARVRRDGAPESERFTAQHASIVDRFVMDGAGAARAVRGLDSAAGLRRLAALRDANGKPWLSASELAAATALRQDWERAQAGLVRGSDWRAPPKGAAPRGANGQGAAMAARCDARRRFADKLAALAAPLRRAVERLVLYDDGVEALERAEGWPARSGKVALKLGLAQLAAR
jgi:hypothetical protein